MQTQVGEDFLDQQHRRHPLGLRGKQHAQRAPHGLVREIPLAGATDAAADLLAGKVRGPLVVNVNTRSRDD